MSNEDVVKPKTADTTQTAGETDIVPTTTSVEGKPPVAFVTGQLDTSTEGYAAIQEQVQGTVDYNNENYVPVEGISQI